MQFQTELLRDTAEINDEDSLRALILDREAEEYHFSMLAGSQPGNRCNDLSGEAERALRSAPSLTWKEFFKKWG